jgi:hypothetical protein
MGVMKNILLLMPRPASFTFMRHIILALNTVDACPPTLLVYLVLHLFMRHIILALNTVDACPPTLLVYLVLHLPEWTF